MRNIASMSRGKVFLIILGVSLWAGMMIGWVGPLAFPPIAQVAQPIVCPGGELAQDIIRGQSANEVTYNTAFQCYGGNSEAGVDVTGSAIFAAMGIYAAISFVVLMVFWVRALGGYRARLAAALQAMDAPGVEIRGKTIDMRDATLDTKLDVLAELRTQDLIDETAYKSMVAQARAKG